MVALNADDGAATDYSPQQGMVSGPIRDITIEHLRAESAFTFVRVLSYRQPIENVTVRDVKGGCRFYAINMDRWKFPPGAGAIRHVTLRDFDIRKMPDPVTGYATAAKRPLIHIQSAAQQLRIENIRRPEGDLATPTLVIDNAQKNHLRLEGLSTAQASDLLKASPAIKPENLAPAPATPAAQTLTLDEPAVVTLPGGGFSVLQLDTEVAQAPASRP
jgi:hypothetical protein